MIERTYDTPTMLVYSKQIARELMRMGNIVFKTVPNYKIQGFVIWVFEDTEKLQRDFSRIMAKRQS